MRAHSRRGGAELRLRRPSPGSTMWRMSTAPVTDLSYPIGKFKYAGPSDEAQRRHHIDEIAAVPERARKAVHGLSDAQLDTPYRPGGWKVRQVIHHLADSHMNAYIRCKLAFTEEVPTVKPYDEKLWADLADMQLPIEISLVLLESLHKRWVTFLCFLKPADFERKFNHPESGATTLDKAVAHYAWHGQHHIAHINKLRERMGWKA